MTRLCRAACLLALLLTPWQVGTQSQEPLPGMPAVLDPKDVYAANRPGKLSPVVAGFPERVYVPNSGRNTVDVIDPHTFKIIDHFAVGKEPQHVDAVVRPEERSGCSATSATA